MTRRKLKPLQQSGSPKKEKNQSGQGKSRKSSMAAVQETIKDVLTEQPPELGWDHSGEPDRTKQIQRQKAFEKAMQGWPWRTELVPDRVLTQAPHAMNQYNYDNVCSLPKVKQTSKLFKLGSDMENKIMNMLFSQGHLAVSGLAATSQEAFHLVAFWASHWDVSRGHYCDCEKIPKFEHATVTEVVVISPFRIRERAEDSFRTKIINLHKMTVAFRNFSENFITLHLHRIPLLTTSLLALVVPYMRKLKFLGLYACELLHLGNLEDLLKIVRTDRGMGMTKNIQLDFYPRFHIGPDPDTVEHFGDYTGSYGATWDNFDGLDTRLGVWAIISRAMKTAQNQGVDLVSKGTALRFWLDQSQCKMVDETIEALQRRPMSWENAIKVAAMVNHPNTKGVEKVYYEEHETTWNIERHTCMTCPNPRLGVFFDFEEFLLYEQHGGEEANSTPPLLCLGCKLTVHMDGEKDHYKNAKKGITEKWLTVGNATITEDLSLAAEREQLGPALNMACNLDKIIAKKRMQGIRQFGTPGIDCERQIRHVENGRIKRYSPHVPQYQREIAPIRW